MTKLCRKCGRDLPIDAFPADGYSPCSNCRRLRQLEWHSKTYPQRRESLNEYQREWRKRNPGYNGRKTPPKYNPATAKRGKDKYLAKPGMRDIARAASRKYYADHRDEILAQKKRAKLARVFAAADAATQIALPL